MFKLHHCLMHRAEFSASSSKYIKLLTFTFCTVFCREEKRKTERRGVCIISPGRFSHWLRPCWFPKSILVLRIKSSMHHIRPLWNTSQPDSQPAALFIFSQSASLLLHQSAVTKPVCHSFSQPASKWISSRIHSSFLPLPHTCAGPSKALFSSGR